MMRKYIINDIYVIFDNTFLKFIKELKMGKEYISNLFSSSEVLWRKGFVNTIDSSMNRFLDFLEDDEFQLASQSNNNLSTTIEKNFDEREDFIHKF